MPPIFTSLGSGAIASYGLVRRATASAILYNSIIFSNTTVWLAPDGVTSIEYLIVAGGGGGTEGAGGHGGGGGEVVTSPSYPVTPGTSYTITVGAGGAGMSTPATPYPAFFGGNGTNSSFGTTPAPTTVVARYGEGAQGSATYAGPRGVARGGGSGAGWTNPLYLGGTGYLANYTEKGGGGGGAGGAGQNYGVYAPNYAGNGGSGIASTISGANTGYGGGGAGGGTIPYPGGGAYAGFASHGGGKMPNDVPNGAVVPYLGNGANNSGGGGGGGNAGTPAYPGSGSGGSGVAIIRYVITGTKTNTTYTFANTTQFTIPSGVTAIQYMMIGGGSGGSGGQSGVYFGGGGASGVMRSSPNFPVNPGTTYTITVGAGGAGTVQSPSGVGSNSRISNSTFSANATGGKTQNNGTNVGAHNDDYLGYSGGEGAYGAGGGAGAGGNATQPGNRGGNGANTTIRGVTETFGGGGSGLGLGNGGTGGLGGGGVSPTNPTSLNAVQNTGSGGGGGDAGGGGGHGSSGLVIIKLL